MKIVHGAAKRGHRTPENSAWSDMRQRCLNPKNHAFHTYGGRGITICKRWDNFANFLADMGNRPEGHSLDRKNVNGPYSKKNCRWVPWETQSNNKRTTRLITWNGITLSKAQWEHRLGLTECSVTSRLKKGWSIERALTEPVNAFRKRTVCRKAGHPLIDDNIIITRRGIRLCRTCYDTRIENYRLKPKG